MCINTRRQMWKDNEKNSYLFIGITIQVLITKISMIALWYPCVINKVILQ